MQSQGKFGKIFFGNISTGTSEAISLGYLQNSWSDPQQALLGKFQEDFLEEPFEKSLFKSEKEFCWYFKKNSWINPCRKSREKFLKESMEKSLQLESWRDFSMNSFKHNFLKTLASIPGAIPRAVFAFFNFERTKIDFKSPALCGKVETVSLYCNCFASRFRTQGMILHIR